MSLKTVLEIEGLSDLQLTELKSTLAEFEQNCLKEKSAPSLKGESHGEPLLATALLNKSKFS
jgi:hypothetical protein